jgi:hypothetical protein
MYLGLKPIFAVRWMPKCGNNNQHLDKKAAVILLQEL